MIWGFVQIEEFGNSVDKMMIDHVIFGYPMFKNKLMWDEKRGQSMMSSFFWHGYAPSIKRHHVYHVFFSGAGRIFEPFPFWDFSQR
jgi:hypothetical protein